MAKTPFEKLHIKAGFSVTILNAPAPALDSLGEVPPSVKVTNTLRGKKDTVVAFVHDQAELKKTLPKIKDSTHDPDRLWIAYPKSSSKLKTDINRDSLHKLCTAAGLQGNHLISLDTTWSIMRFRKTDATKPLRTGAKKAKVAPQMSDEAVAAKTGKTWPQWYAALDKVNATTMTHQQIVRHLKDEHGIGPWWQQMVTVTYEQARGMRAKHEKKGGFEISASKTIAVPIERLWETWNDESLRQQWLETPVTVRKATKNKSMRITWESDNTNVDAYFWNKGPEKSQIQVQHNKLPDAAAGEEKKAFWKARLEILKGIALG